jgi:GntR family transcriptional regulator / MocR family aminotransferase
MAGSDVSESIFFLDRSSHTALQAQIRQTVVSAVLSGDLTPGSRLPSTRRLSVNLHVSRITVSLAYQELISQGYLEANGRSGYRISMSAPVARLRGRLRPEAQTAIDWPGRLRTRFSAFRRVRKPLDWRSYPFPFLYGQTDMSLFDLGAWRDCTRRAHARSDFDFMAGDFAPPTICSYGGSCRLLMLLDDSFG